MDIDAGTLGEFLRSRRARVTPADVGLPRSVRRRTPGLRREEVATLAGVSVDYYTRLEQGRDRHPSAAVLDALSLALRLTEDERSHLSLLAGQPAARTAPVAARQVRPSVHALLETLLPLPAYVLSQAADILAWNVAVPRVLFEPAAVPTDERNLVRMTIVDPQMRRLWVDWDDVAREGVAQLRDAAVRYPHDTRLRAMVGELLVTSPEFSRWWQEHDVAIACGRQKRVNHPECGSLRLYHESLHLVADGQIVVFYLPADDASTQAVRRLTESAGNRAPALRLVPGI